MTKFKGSYITNAGKTLMFDGQNVTFTKAALCSQDLSGLTEDQIRALTSLSGEQVTAAPSIAGRTDSSININAAFTNRNLTEDISFNTIGWYAKSDSTTETLMAVTLVNGEAGVLPGQSPDGTTDSISPTLQITVGNAKTINSALDPSGFVTQATLDGQVKDLKASITDAVNQLAQMNGKYLPVNAGDINDDILDKKFMDKPQIRIYQYSPKNDPLSASNITCFYDVSNGSGILIVADTFGNIAINPLNGSTYSSWINLANKNDFNNYVKFDTYNQSISNIDTLLSDLTTELNEFTSRLTEDEGTIKYLKENQFLVQHYAKADEATANTWESADPLHRMAIIDDK